VRASLIAAAAFLMGLCSGCAWQQLTPRPMDASKEQARYLAQGVDDERLRASLSRRGIDTTVWPLRQWSEAALDALALERHPDIQVAAAELDAAIAASRLALQRARPGLDVTVEHHSVNGASSSPWSVGVALDTVLGQWLVGEARQSALVDMQQAQVLEATYKTAEVTWESHRRVRQAFGMWMQSDDAAKACADALELRQRELGLWQRREILGAASRPEVLNARQRAVGLEQQCTQQQIQRDAALGLLASATGLPLSLVRGLSLESAPQEAVLPSTTAALEWQRAALLNNLAVRSALARYAVADAALRFEIARQIPDVSLRPGYTWDQGDHRWSLGLGFPLPPWSLNQAAIADASARRDTAAARFVAVQTRAVSDLDIAISALEGADRELASSHANFEAARQGWAQAKRHVERGTADRLEELGSAQTVADARRSLIDAQAARARSMDAIEDVLQTPLSRLWGASGTGSHKLEVASESSLPADRP
jgi:outer membrane protein TolC